MPEKDERKEDGVSDPGLVLIGGSFIGEGAEAAHVNTALGQRTGPPGTANPYYRAVVRTGAGRAR